MSNIITIASGNIGGAAVQTVSARELHAYLEVATRFNDWVTTRIADFGFVENQDFTTFTENPVKGRPSKEYALTIDMAKELSMVERNEKGKQARQYFIECERQAKAMAPAIPQTLPEALRLAAEAIEDRDRLALENKAQTEALAEAAPKVRALERIASPTEGAVCLRIAAKLLQMPEKQFFQFANAEGYIFRHHHSRVWQGYAEKAKAGLVEQKFTTVTRDDGSEKTVEQVLITRLGIAKLAEKLERRKQCEAMMATGSTGGQSKHSPMQR